MIQTRHSAVLATLALLLLPLLLLELLLYFLLFLALLLAFLLLHRKTTGTAAVTGTATCADAKARSTASILRELRRGRFRRSAAAVVQEVMSADLPEDLLAAEELVAEVCQTLEVCDFSSKVLRDLQRSLGESCLYLSGGGMLGMYHLGTVRRLLEEDLMPQHLCGTSAVRLLEKAPDGSLRPWSGSSELMRDGTMLADSPCEQMQRWNLRWSIVSQVNPHVVPFSMPFVLAKRISQFSGVFASRLTSAEGWLRRCIWSTLRSFQGWSTLPREGSWISQLLFQDYFGNAALEAALLRRSFCEDGSDRVGSRSLRSRRIAGRRERRV